MRKPAIAWSSWEGETVSVEGPDARPEKFDEPEFAVAFARIENWFFTNGGFFPEEDWILKNVDLPCEGITTPGGFGGLNKTFGASLRAAGALEEAKYQHVAFLVAQ